MLKKSYLQWILIEIICIVVPAIVIGIVCSQLMLALIVALLILLVWNYFNLIKLSNWVWQPKRLYPPNSIGSFDVIYYGLHKRQKRLRLKQNELAQLIQLFRVGAESVPDSLLMVDDSGKIEWCNKMTQYELGIRWPDDKGQSIINLLRYPELTSYMRKKDFRKPLTLFFKQKKHIEFRIIPYIENYWIVIVRDVDQIYLAERQRHDFFTNASHELRTPLTVMQGYLEMLNDDLVQEKNRENVYQTMQHQAERMESLIGQILALSEIENTSTTAELTLIDIPKILNKAKFDITQLYPQYQVIFDIDEQLHVFGHKAQLDSAVNNLIYNAIKHTPAGTQIKVLWQQRNEGAYFSVSDNGQGIAPQHLERLTERFYQVDSARSNNQQSSGLGLAIVKHVLLNHGHTKLEITSQLNKGSCFSFLLPKQFIVRR